MKRLILLLCLCLLVVPVLGTKENFQDWSGSSLTLSPPPSILLTGSTTGVIQSYVPGRDSYVFISETTPSAFTYFAVDYSLSGSNIPVLSFRLYDANNNAIGSVMSTTGSGRAEIKISGGTPLIFINGVQNGSSSIISENPTSIRLSNANSNPDGTSNVYLDNIIIGETDHHITGSLPTNWSIQRDLINPAATGVYAWDSTTSEWVLENSYHFYVDADKEYLNSETLSIRHSGGTVINATSLLPVHNLVEYDLDQFLSTSTSVGTTVPDGQYSVSWDSMSPPNWFADTFWIMSNGGVVSWNHDRYSQGDTATIDYTMSAGYFDLTTYTYALVIQDMYGSVKETIPINQQTGTESVTLTSSTYPSMVYNVLLQATTISDSSVHIMNYDGMEVTGYISFVGTVMDAETTLPISGAYVNVSQGTTTTNTSSLSSGEWNSTGNFLTGTVIRINATATGYDTYTNSFIPQIAKTIPLNISMMPLTKLCTGVCIGGIVNESVYHNPIPGATYHVRNGTEFTATTNIAGYARVDSLSNGVLYDVWSTKTGFANSTITQKLAVGI